MYNLDGQQPDPESPVKFAIIVFLCGIHDAGVRCRCDKCSIYMNATRGDVRNVCVSVNMVVIIRAQGVLKSDPFSVRYPFKSG